LLLTIVLLAFATLSAVRAEAPQPAAWKLLKIPGKAVTAFAAGPHGAIKVSASDSVGFLYRNAADMSGTGSLLSWRWRVDMTPPPTALDVKGMDDRPLAVHVWFGDEGRSGSDWGLKARLGAWLFDQPLPGKMLTYVWGGTAKRGDVMKNPYRESAGQIIVLRPGDSAIGTWFEESVDFAADFEAAFGYRPGMPAYIAVSADTDDKGGRSMGTVTDIAFRKWP
jgi:hypothetical protein